MKFYYARTLGIPLKPMLAHPTKSISEVLDRFENMPFTCEFKYDGERAQIHKLAIDPTTGKPPKEDLCIFSRNQENMSSKYPDIMETMRVAPKEGVSSFVLDTEAVAWDAKEGHILPFQVLSTRKRKVSGVGVESACVYDMILSPPGKDVTAEDIKVQVCVFAFDILYLNGEV